MSVAAGVGSEISLRWVRIADDAAARSLYAVVCEKYRQSRPFVLHREHAGVWRSHRVFAWVQRVQLFFRGIVPVSCFWRHLRRCRSREDPETWSAVLVANTGKVRTLFKRFLAYQAFISFADYLCRTGRQIPNSVLGHQWGMYSLVFLLHGRDMELHGAPDAFNIRIGLQIEKWKFGVHAVTEQ